MPIRVKVAPGDRITAAVLVSGTQVILQVTNRTRRVRFTKRVPVADPDLSSAEWIAEAPSACDPAGGCRTLPLTQFGAVSFTGAAATGDGHAGTISDPGWKATSIELAEAPQGGFDPRLVPAPTRPTMPRAPTGICSGSPLSRNASQVMQASAASVTDSMGTMA